MTVQQIKLSEVRAGPCRLRSASQELIHWLSISWKEFGLIQLPLINTRTNNIIDGRLIVQVARKEGASHLEMICIDVDVKLEDVIRLVRNNHAGDWDWREVAAVLKVNDPKLSGFHTMDWAPMLAADWKPVKVDNDAQFEMELD